MKDYLFRLWRSTWNTLVSLDQFANVAIGFLMAVLGRDSEYGWPDETISSVLGRKTEAEKTNKLEDLIVWVLDKIDEGHVFEAIERRTNPDPAAAVVTAPRWQANR